MPALLTAIDSTSHIHLIVGSNPLASSRCARSLIVGAKPKVVASGDPDDMHYSLRKRIDDGEVEWIKAEKFQLEFLETLGREEVGGVVDAVFVTSGARSQLAVDISNACRRLRIPVNVTDAPNLCTFTLLSTHDDGPLQIGVTTSGKGCKLASRIRREIAATLPSNLGQACERLGTVRRRLWEEDYAASAADLDAAELEEEEDMGQKSTFNQLITDEDLEASKSRRMRWLSQICEYWPLKRLAAITDEDVDTILRNYASHNLSETSDAMLSSATLDSRSKKGRIILAGSGPGSPDLLTTATLKAILAADTILADKLVPAAVLDLIPRRTPVHIARKFPGNADKAQEELLQWGLEALQKGQLVLRLKQGDPYIYGRGAEEYEYFHSKGYPVTVLPGITSSLSAPLFANIPATHRGVADQVLICTGTGRKGALPQPPEYRQTRTVVFLMALHRLSALIESLTCKEYTTTTSSTKPLEDGTNPEPKITRHENTQPWPLDTPCAVLERASCPDQRIIRSTLRDVVAAIEESGSRPPGLLVVGWSCDVLRKLEKGVKWVVEDGFKGLEGIEGLDVLQGFASPVVKAEV